MRQTLSALSVIATLIASATSGRAADYTIDPTHSHILFMIDHLGFAKIVGLFSDFSGTLSFDANNVPASKLSVTVKTESLQTQFAPRDKDLKGADWFNTTEFPVMTYIGSEFLKKDEHTGALTGKLTLHGATKPFTLNVALNKDGQNPQLVFAQNGFGLDRATMKPFTFFDANLDLVSDLCGYLNNGSETETKLCNAKFTGFVDANQFNRPEIALRICANPTKGDSTDCLNKALDLITKQSRIKSPITDFLGVLASACLQTPDSYSSCLQSAFKSAASGAKRR